MSTVLWTNAKYLITAGPAVLATASVTIEVTTPEDTAGVAVGSRHQDGAGSKDLFCLWGRHLLWALSNMPPLPQTVITAVLIEKLHSNERKTIQLGSRGFESKP